MKFSEQGDSLLIRGEHWVYLLILGENRIHSLKDIPCRQVPSIINNLYRTIKIENDLFYVTQTDFHPLSENHITVLTSDNYLRIYRIDKLGKSQEEQKILLLKKSEKLKNEKVVAFTFGQNRGWERFTIYFITNSGNFYYICPIIPYNW